MAKHKIKFKGRTYQTLKRPHYLKKKQSRNFVQISTKKNFIFCKLSNPNIWSKVLFKKSDHISSKTVNKLVSKDAKFD